MPSVQALLFDLGGVVLHIDFDRALAAWQPHSPWSLAQLRERFRFDEAYQRHETGELAAEGYFAHVRETLQLDCDDGTLGEGWNRILCAPIPETLALLHAVRHVVPCYALTNTNATHYSHMHAGFASALLPFREVFASHRMGHRKPAAEAFAHVVRAIGVPADQVLFFDDLQDNVDGARRFGLQAVLVRGPHDVREALAARGLVPQ